MGSVNKVILVGNLGKDAEVRYTTGGSAVATISVATTEVWNDKSSGERQEKTEWHRVVIRGFWQKALVLSEPSELPPGVVAGTHLIVAPLDEMPEMIRWLLDTPEGRRNAEQVRDAAYRLLTEEYDLRRWARELAYTLRP